MSELDQLIKNSIENDGAQEDTNKFYVTFFRTTLHMPAHLNDDEVEPFSPLYLQDGDNYFIPLFDSVDRLTQWLSKDDQATDYVEIEGSDVVRCVGNEHVYLCLNPGTEFYKEFSPEELQRLKLMIAKIDKLKNPANKTH
jgi:hypothetical protein